MPEIYGNAIFVRKTKHYLLDFKNVEIRGFKKREEG